ncbi:ESPR-type extended signal peptide-containing protein [Stenotrophomonas maltophilia]
MNHVYRRIWSNTRQCWVVASEIAAASGKDNRRILGGIVVFCALIGPSISAANEVAPDEDGFEMEVRLQSDRRYADDRNLILAAFAGPLRAPSGSTELGPGASANGLYAVGVGRNSQASQSYTVAMGNEAKASGLRSIAIGGSAVSNGLGAIALGNGAASAGNYSVASGDGASASAHYSMALGGIASASGNGSVALGYDSTASAYQSLALGYRSASSGSNALAVGRYTQSVGESDVAIGSYAKTVGVGAGIARVAIGEGAAAGTQGYTGAVALGGRSKAEFDSVSIGYNSKASKTGAVALGGHSVADEANTVSVGNSTTKRRIVNLADAQVSDSSTDAVTGRQLYATEQKIGSLTGMLKTGGHSDSFLVGTGSVSASENSVSVGSSSGKRRIQYIADGVVDVGSTDAITGNQLHATNQNVASAMNAASDAKSTALSAKTNADSALAKANTLSGLLSETSASGNVRLGASNSGTVMDVRNSASANRRITGVADATLSSTSTDVVTGRQLNTTNSNVSTAMSDASSAKTTANTALTQVGTLNGLLNQVSANGNVRVGEKNSGTVLDVRNSANANRKLTGVADGVVSAGSYEAVNGRQLNATNEKVVAVEGVARSAAADATLAKVDAAKALAETAVLGGLVAQVSASGDVRLGEKNSGTALNVRNSANANRKISGVADGVLSSSSAEAVSGNQLYSTNSRVSELEGVAQFVGIGSAPFSERAQAGVAGVAVGNSAKTGLDGGTAVGTFAEAMGKNSTAIGRAAAVSENSENGFAMGAGAQVGGDAGGAYAGVAIGASASVEGGAHGSLALGNGSLADEEGVASFGGVGIQRRLVNIARGTADHNATTVSQLKDSLATLGGGAGMDADGNIIVPTYAVQGGTQSTVEDALMVLDGAVITAGRRADKVEGQLSSIFQDSPSTRADGMNQIALNGANGMVLTNLADGRVAPGSRDAVTGSQLHAAEQKISQNRNDLEAMRKERKMGEQAMRGLDASVIDYGGARLTGVAEAKLSTDSSDVVRGSQLYETNSRVSAMEGISQYVSVGTAPEHGSAQAGPVGLAIGNLAKTGIEGGTAIGTFAEAMGKNSIALGRASTVYQGSDSSFAIGTGAAVGRAGEPGAIGAIAFGVGSRVEPGAHGSIALGTSSYAAEAGVVSFGSVGTKRRLVNIANGTANHNAATVGQLRGALSALGGEVDANGNIVGPSFNVQGQSQSTVNAALEALDGAVVSTTSRVNQVESQLRSVFQETPSVRADGTHRLTLAGANGMVISNVANGLIAAGSRDAVNGGQLHSMQQQLNGRMDGLEQRIDDQPQARAMAAASTPSPSTEEIAPTPETSGSPQIASTGEGDKPTPQPKSKQDDTPKPQVDTADLEKMLARANEYTDGAISTFERRLDKMDKRFNRMAAMSSAQSAMAMNTAGLATYNRLGAGVGYSEGESAMAVGYQRVLNEKGSATFSLNGAFTNSGERSMGVGVGIGW